MFLLLGLCLCSTPLSSTEKAEVTTEDKERATKNHLDHWSETFESLYHGEDASSKIVTDNLRCALHGVELVLSGSWSWASCLSSETRGEVEGVAQPRVTTCFSFFLMVFSWSVFPLGLHQPVKKCFCFYYYYFVRGCALTGFACQRYGRFLFFLQSKVRTCLTKLMRCLLSRGAKRRRCFCFCTPICRFLPPAFTPAVYKCVPALLLLFFACMQSHDRFSDSWWFLQAFPTPPYLILCCLSSCVRAGRCTCLQLCVCVCAHMNVLTGRLLELEVTTHKAECYSRVFLVSLLSISAAESLVEETWHSIFCCSRWLPVTHAPTFGAQLD